MGAKAWETLKTPETERNRNETRTENGVEQDRNETRTETVRNRNILTSKKDKETEKLESKFKNGTENGLIPDFQQTKLISSIFSWFSSKSLLSIRLPQHRLCFASTINYTNKKYSQGCGNHNTKNKYQYQ